MAREARHRRSCVSCRTRRHPRELLRFCLDLDGCLILDSSQRRQGRGVWLCPIRKCIERVERRTQGIKRALRVKQLAVGQLLTTAQAHARARIISSFVQSFRSGLLIGGTTRILSITPVPPAAAVLLARDIGTVTRERLHRHFTPLPRWHMDMTADALGKLIERGPRAAFLLHSGAPARMLIADLQRCHDLG